MESKKLVQQFFDNPHKVTKNTDSFIKALKRKAPKNLDSIVHELHYEAFEKIDCLDCANCCKTLGPGVKDVDIERLAKHLKMKPSQVVEQYFKIDSDGDYIFKEHPCPFLMPDNYCLVYEARPKACREYPHTDRRRFAQLLNLSKKNMETCPIVHDVIENLQTKL